MTNLTGVGDMMFPSMNNKIWSPITQSTSTPVSNVGSKATITYHFRRHLKALAEFQDSNVISTDILIK